MATKRYMITITPIAEAGMTTEVLGTTLGITYTGGSEAERIKDTRRMLQDGLDDLMQALEVDDNVARLMDVVVPEPEPEKPDNGKRLYGKRRDFMHPMTLLRGTEAWEMFRHGAIEELMEQVEQDGGKREDYRVEFLPLARLSMTERFFVVAIRKPLTLEDVRQEFSAIE